MNKYKWLIILNLVLILMYAGFVIWKQEKVLRNEQTYLLELAPVDPRSLMQGDYMVLNYQASQSAESTLLDEGYLIFTEGENRILEWNRTQENLQPQESNELALKFRKDQRGRIQLGIESYFFQEGKGSQFEQAKYGAIKIATDATCRLVYLVDRHFERIGD